MVFERQQVVAVYERGDSLANGALIGLGAGAVLGVIAGATSECENVWSENDCANRQEGAEMVVGAVLFGAVGAGVGVGIDALITGKRLVYQRPPGAEARALSIVPAVGRSGARVLVAVAW